MDKKQVHLFSILALVVSLISLFMSLYNLVPIAGIVLGVIALAQGAKGSDKVMSIIAIVISSIDFIINFFLLTGM